MTVFKDLAPRSNAYFVHLGDQKCYGCSITDKGGPHVACATCQQKTGASIECLSCNYTVTTSTNVQLTPVVAPSTATAALQCANACPEGCYECELLVVTGDGNAKAVVTQCKVDSCRNGFRATVETLSSSPNGFRRTCKACTGDNVLRCGSDDVTNVNSKEVPTQCKTASSDANTQSVGFRDWMSGTSSLPSD